MSTPADPRRSTAACHRWTAQRRRGGGGGERGRGGGRSGRSREGGESPARRWDWNPAFVSAAGLRLRVGRLGAGRPLLLITGIGAHLDMWAPSCGSSTDRELIAFDAPGTGLSQRPRFR